MTNELQPPIDDSDLGPHDDAGWNRVAEMWDIRHDTVYLNHGSFGPAPNTVRQYRRQMIDRLNQQPMDFYVRQLEPLLTAAKRQTSEFVGTAPENLVFVENATYGVNVVAESFPLRAGDEILLNNHEYGAVQRIWDRAAQRVGAKTIVATLPNPIESADQVVDALLAHVTPATRLAIISHITSPTALIMPVQQLCRAFLELGIAVCIDGPHAPAQIDLNIDSIGCDFYAASCHKWLCATLGTGFCYADPKWHDQMQPVLKSWGRLLPALPQTWAEEFIWPGTRDPSGYLTIPVAIDTMNEIGWNRFRTRCYAMAEYASQSLVELTRQPLLAPRDWYGCMAHVPLPIGNYDDLQQYLWNRHRIEVPIIQFDSSWFVRVSCHVYNRRGQIDLLIEALSRYLRQR